MSFSFSKLMIAAVVTASLFTQSASAARIFPAGFDCSPDCFNDFSSLNGDVSYSVSGSTGTLTYTGTPGNVVLRDQDLEIGTSGTGSVDGQVGYPISNIYFDNGVFHSIFAGTAPVPLFNFSIIFDTSLVAGTNGGFVANSGDLDINGSVVTTVGSELVTTVNGEDLTGDLVTSDIVEFGFLDTEIDGAASSGSSFILDFLGNLDVPNSLISDITGGVAPIHGIATISLDDVGSYNRNLKWYEQNWNGSADVNVVVPVPGAIVFFVSGLSLLLGRKWV